MSLKKKYTENAPWWWKRTESALIYFFTGLIPIVGLSRTLSQDMTHDITLIWLPGAILAVKSFGIFFMGVQEGNDNNWPITKEERMDVIKQIEAQTKDDNQLNE